MKKLMRALALFLALLLAVPAAGAQELGNSVFSMIHFSPNNSDRHFIGSPSLVIASDGAYYACHNYFGNQTGRTYVYKSTDRGSTWECLNQDDPIVGMFWATIFEAEDFDEQGAPNGEKALYIMGTKGVINGNNAAGYDEISIAKVTGGGETITQPVFFGDALGGHKVFHTGDTPILRVNGRIYKTFEYVKEGGWGANFRTAILAIDEDLDPMVPGNWRITPELRDNNRLEGIPVLAPDGQIYSFMRNAGGNSDLGHEHTDVQVYKMDPDVDPYETPEDFAMYEDEAYYRVEHMPGVRFSKFFILRDEVTNRYLWFVNRAQYSDGTGRNVLDMYESKDLVDWHYVMNIVEDDQGLSVADSISDTSFSQMTAVIDGEDLVLVCRTSYDRADSAHNSNHLSFHRVPLFRQHLDAGREVAFYSFDDPAKPGRDSSISADKDVVLPDGLITAEGRYGKGIRPAEGLYGDLGPRVNTTVAHEYFDGSSQFSFAAWVKPDALKDRSTLFANYAAGDRPGFELYLDGEGKLHLLASCSGGAVREAVCDMGLEADAWSHVAVTLDYMDGTAQFYLDGGPVDTQTLELGSEYAPQSSAQAARLGAGMEAGSWFAGTLDEVHLYREVIGEDKIDYLFDYTGDPAALSDLTVNGETIPGFNPYVRTYELSTKDASADVTAVPLKGDPVEVKGVAVPKEDGSPYVLDYGVASLEVQGETYHVDLRRKSADATLEKIALLGGLFPPEFKADTFEYTIHGLAVPKDYVPETIIDRAMAKSYVHGARAVLGPVTGDFSREPYVLTQTVAVTAEDGTEEIYTFHFVADKPLIDDGERCSAPQHLAAAWDFQGDSPAQRLADKAPVRAGETVKDTLALQGIEGRFQFEDGKATILSSAKVQGGTGACLMAPNSADLSQDGPMTIWVRFKMDKPTTTEWPVLVDKRVFGSNSQRPYSLFATQNTDDNDTFGVRAELARKGSPASGVTFDTGDNAGMGYDQWQEVALVIDRKSITNDLNLTIYGAVSEGKAGTEDFNVLLHKEMGFAELCQSDTPLRIGGYNNAVNSYDITFDEVRIYDRDLSVEELAAISPEDLKASPSDNTLAELYLDGRRLADFTGQDDFSATVYKLDTDGMPALTVTAVPSNADARVTVDRQDPLCQQIIVTPADKVSPAKTYTLRVTLKEYALSGIWEDKTAESGEALTISYDEAGIMERREGQPALTMDGTHPARVDKALAGHLDGAKTITVAAWMRPDKAPSGAHGFLFGGVGSSAKPSIDMALDKAMTGILVGGRSTADEKYRGGLIPYPGGFKSGKWYHIAAEYDYAGKTVKLYVNGVLAGQQKADFASATYAAGAASGDFGIGCDATGARAFFGGLGGVKIYDRALTAEELLTLSENEPPSTDPLDHMVAAWNFTGKDDAERLADKATAGRDQDDLSLVGDPAKFSFDAQAGTATIAPGAITCFQADSSDDLSPTGPMTVWVKFKLSGSADWPVLVDNRVFGTVRPFALFGNGANGSNFSLSAQLAAPALPNGSARIDTTDKLACDVWQTAAMVVSRDDPDGDLKLSIYATAAADPSPRDFTVLLDRKDLGFQSLCAGNTPLRIGGYNSGTADNENRATIAFDEVRIYDMALTTEELAAIDHGDLGPEPPQADPTTIWEDCTEGEDPYTVTADEGITAATRDEGKPAFHFDGTQAVKVGVGLRNNLSMAETVTVSAWMKPDEIPESGGQPQFLFGGYNKEGGGAAAIDLAFVDRNTMLVGGRCKNGGAYKGGEVALDSGFQAGEWYHVLAQYDYKADRILLYIDGQLAGGSADVGFEQDYFTSTYSTKAPFTIGTDPSGIRGFTGCIGEVKVYTRALTAQEIADLSETEAPPEEPAAGLEGVAEPEQPVEPEETMDPVETVDPTETVGPEETEDPAGDEALPPDPQPGPVVPEEEPGDTAAGAGEKAGPAPDAEG